MVVTPSARAPMVARMKSVLFLLCILAAGCASAPATQQDTAAVGGAVGCLAQGIAAAADSGKGELVAVGIVLMPLCALLASNNPERVYAQGPWAYGSVPKRRGFLASRK